MGDPAGMSKRDITDTIDTAKAIVAAVTNDVGTPSGVLIGRASQLGVSPDTLILWLAQVITEKP